MAPIIKFTLTLSLLSFCQLAMAQSTLAIQGSMKSICPGDQVTLYGMNTSSSTVWQPGGQTSKFITVSPTVSTIYTLTSGGTSVSYSVNVCDNNSCADRPTDTFTPLAFNTGSNGLTGVKTIGQSDQNWQISSSLDGPYAPAITSDNSVIPGNYSKSNWPNAQWIGPNANLRSIAGDYYYKLEFPLVAEQLQDLSMSMQFMADNTVMAVYVNGVEIPNSNTPNNSIYGFQMANASSVTMKDNWVVGQNSIVVKIHDEGGYSGFLAQLNPLLRIPVATIPACDESLPVHFAQFNANNNQDNTVLNWLASTRDISHFIIEKSADCINFTAIGQVAVLQQNKSLQYYTFHDNEGSQTMAYYRLGAYELSGIYTYSTVRSAKRHEEKLQIRQDPNSGNTLFVSTPEAGTVTISNTTGTQFPIPANDGSQHEMNLSYLPAGVYIVHFVSEEHQLTQKFIKAE